MLIDDDFSTADIGEAEELIGRVYRRGVIRESSRPFSFRQRVQGDEHANFARFEISSTAELAVDFEGVIGIGHRASGHYRATTNGDAVDASGAFILRPGEAQSWSMGLDLLMVNLRVDELASYIDEDARSATVTVAGVAPVSESLADHWDRAVSFSSTVFTDSELLANDLLRTSAVDTLYLTALTAFPIEVAGRTSRAHDTAVPRAVRRAIVFIENSADQVISVSDIAMEARLSVRGLQAAFQREFGTTPLAYLRMVRLSAVRRELSASDPSKTTVAAVARRWGFVHLSRFAHEYRREFGELPHDTLAAERPR